MLCNKNMYTCAVVLAFLLASVSIDRIDGAPDGAPLEACATMTPNHGVNPQLINSSPFKTEIPSGEYAIMDNTLNLELRSKNDVTTYKGFLVMAFDKNDATKPIGTFKLPSDGKVIDCSGIVGSAATHKFNNEKKLTTVQWTPPKNFMGTAIFRTTYVHNGTTFWVKTESIAVTYVMELPTSSTQAPVATTPSSASQSSKTWISLITFSLMAYLMR
ncbi:putative Secreted protein [Daphnia magna]|uniref:Putative Secreted protein n=1 Tax=Daphnia magna TaxID=35525 RepID=A0A164WE97_9CRUS|nr:putative Secreted protein [Daphnia magna]